MILNHLKVLIIKKHHQVIVMMKIMKNLNKLDIKVIVMMKKKKQLNKLDQKV